MTKTLNILLSEEAIDFEGVNLKKSSGLLEKGDTYITERNTGPKLLTVKEIKDNIVIPEEWPEYCYNLDECVKVEFVD